MGDKLVSAVTLSSAGDDALSTAHLLRRARSGDRAALDSLFGRQLQMLRRWAVGRLPRWARDGADTDDLIQDVLLQTWKRIDAFEPRGSGALRAYLRSAVVNRVRDELRRQPRHPVAIHAVEGVLRAPGPSPLDQAVSAESIGRYDRALDRLRPTERACLIGRLEFGLTFEELAEWLEKPSVEAARKATQRALMRLMGEMDRDPSAMSAGRGSPFRVSMSG